MPTPPLRPPPTAPHPPLFPPSPNFTLRDWLAGQALAGMLAAPGNVAEMDCGERARYAYLNADAMLKEREGA
jgi:hypothetical protein